MRKHGAQEVEAAKASRLGFEADTSRACFELQILFCDPCGLCLPGEMNLLFIFHSGVRYFLLLLNPVKPNKFLRRDPQDRDVTDMKSSAKLG